MSAQKGGKIVIRDFNGNGKYGIVNVGSMCSGTAGGMIDVDVSQNQKLYIVNNIKKCVLQNDNDFDSVNYSYFIKKETDGRLSEIEEYIPLQGEDDEEDVVDLCDVYKPNVNYKVRI